MENYSERWAQMELEVDDSTTVLTRRVMPHSPTDIFLAVIMPDKQRALLIVANENLFSLKKLLPKCRGLHIYLAPGSNAQETSLVIKLEDRRYADVFSTLAFDIASKIHTSSSPKEAFENAIDRLRRWQFFLREQSPDGLTPEQQRGLFGEVFFLEKLLDNTIPSARAVGGWKGPDAAAKDFVFSRTGVEIKTGLSKNHARVRIANEHQLDLGGLEHLYLSYLSLELIDGGSLTLPSLVERVRTYIANDATACQAFEDLLLKTRYHEIHRPLYEDIRYRVRADDLYAVRDDFPRMTPLSLPAGVGDLSYTIIVSDCARFRTKSDELYKKIRGLANVQ